MRTYILFFLLFSISYTTLFAAPQDRRRGSSDEEAIALPVEGIVYSLPRSGFVIEVKAQKNVFKPGPYAAYAKRYLGIENAIVREKISWEITAIDVDGFSEADPDAMFIAKDSVAARLSMLPNGIVSGINTGEFIEPVDEIIGSDFIVRNDAYTHMFTDLSSDDFYNITVESETGTERFQDKSIEEKAREAADYIMRLRKKRSYEILDPSDVIPEDGTGYKVFVEEAHRLDEKYTELFTGKQFNSEHIFSFIFIPDGNNVRNEVLFRFNEEKGILPKSDMSGRPVFISMSKDQKAFESAQRLSKAESPQAGQSGAYYRIPLAANITISEGVNTIYTGKSIVAQYGVFAPVPENFLTGKYKIHFNTQTGAIKNVTAIK